MTTNSRLRSHERVVETTVHASQSRYIEDSRYEAEVAPYSFEREHINAAGTDEKD